MLANLKSICLWLGRKWLGFIVTVFALCLVGLADKQAAEAVSWALVAAYGVFAGANSAIEIKGGKGPLPVKPPPQEGS